MTITTSANPSRFLPLHTAFVERLNGELDAVLQPERLDAVGTAPERLVAAMRHALLAGGKRLRPFLLAETARLFGRDDECLRAGAAVECLHTYSLIHDDLPAMDNDDLRRGLPTVHRAFDEATAILAGDTLLTLSFQLLAEPETHPDAMVRSELVLMLAKATGAGGMAGGQMLDLAAEHATLTADQVRNLQAMKTGALIAVSCEMGACLAGAGEEDRAVARDFGAALGLAFQIADDLIDKQSTSEEAGKATGKDEAAGKATLVHLLGAEEARRLLDATIAEAETMMGRYGERGETLVAAARFIAQRSH
ncbi:polyprenyl synthetase family protein [Afifella sp. JA880]|uniref:polyprenyl synthetase family protein n=1 Tax=Afifella sp. JA880 TaxID=2975280 RepID=UPI0021BAE988|nr:farnesyl diphosphate synthase [Afifella sp. JA880]MCT8268398.1 polyprenyl synthetase family protein [Afifella sp. JA880]